MHQFCPETVTLSRVRYVKLPDPGGQKTTRIVAKVELQSVSPYLGWGGTMLRDRTSYLPDHNVRGREEFDMRVINGFTLVMNLFTM